jgi:hypothetical protein
MNINKYHQATCDKAFYKGDFYSNKAPGLAFTALPAAAFTRWCLNFFRIGNDMIVLGRRLTPKFKLVVYVCRLFTVGLAASFMAFALFQLALKLGASLQGAIFATLSMGLATPIWGWSTAFFAHVLSASCLFLAFVFVFFLNQISPESRLNAVLGFAIGALLAWAMVVEYTAAPASAIVALFLLQSGRQWKRTRFTRVLGVAAVGWIVFALPLFLYNKIAFGSPIVTGYNYAYVHVGHQIGILGFTYPSPTILLSLLFSPYRGIFWYAPILLASLPAMALAFRSGKHRSLLITITLIACYYLLMNSAYWYWYGGWSTGPRFLTATLPFVCLPLAILFTRLQKTTLRLVLGVQFLLSMFVTFLAAVVNMTVPRDAANPVIDILIPSFLSGQVRTIFKELGFGGHAGLFPLYFTLIAMFLFVWLATKKKSISS